MEGRARVVGHRPRPHRGAAATRRTSRSTRRARPRACPLNIVGSLQAPADRRRRDRRRRDRGLRDGSARARRHRRRSAVAAASTSCSRTSSHDAWAQGRDLDLPTLVGQVQHAADAQARRVRARHVLPAERPHAARLRLNGLLPRRRSRPGARATPLDIDAMLHTRRRQAAAARSSSIAHLSRRGAPVRRRRSLLAKLVTWMRAPAGHHRPAGPRSTWTRSSATCRPPPTPPTKKPIMHAAEAGPRLRRRRGAGDAEPGRPRLQGDLQRGHLDGRPAADRAGQGPAARRHERRRRRGRRRRGRATRSAGSAKREFVLRRAGEDHAGRSSRADGR